MERVEIIDASLVVVVEHGEEPDDDARERQGVEDRVEELHVDASEAPTDAVQQHRWKIKYSTLYRYLWHYKCHCLGQGKAMDETRTAR